MKSILSSGKRFASVAATGTLTGTFSQQSFILILRVDKCEKWKGIICSCKRFASVDVPLQLRLQRFCNSKVFPLTFHFYLLWEDEAFLTEKFPLQLRLQTFCQRKVATFTFYRLLAFSVEYSQLTCSVACHARLDASDRLSDGSGTWFFSPFFSARISHFST